MNSNLKMIFMKTPRILMREQTSRYVANPIPALCKVTIAASWQWKFLAILFHFLQAQSTLLLLLANFHTLLCFKKVKMFPPGHLQLLKSLPLLLTHPPHLRKYRESVRVRMPLLIKTELRLKSLHPLQLRNTLVRWQSMRKGWLRIEKQLQADDRRLAAQHQQEWSRLSKSQSYRSGQDSEQITELSERSRL